MHVEGRHYRTIWPDGDAVCVIDQTKLPFAFEVRRLAAMAEAAEAIRTMVVRGAPLIGATAAYGLALAMRAASAKARSVRSPALSGRSARPMRSSAQCRLTAVGRVAPSTASASSRAASDGLCRMARATP